MEKEWYKSKAIWGAVALLAGNLLSGNYDSVPALLQTIGLPLSIVGVRLAQK